MVPQWGLVEKYRLVYGASAPAFGQILIGQARKSEVGFSRFRAESGRQPARNRNVRDEILTITISGT